MDTALGSLYTPHLTGHIMNSQIMNSGNFTGLRPQTRGISISGRPHSFRNKCLSRSSSASSLKSSLVSTVISIPNPHLSSADIEQIIYQRVNELGEDLRNAFTALDADQNFTVTKGEFYRVLQNFILPLTPPQFDGLLAKIPMYGNGAIPYLTFLEKFHHVGTSHGKNVKRSASQVTQVMTLSELETQLKTAISKNLKAVVRACRIFDYNQNGQIQKHELRRILENYCFKMKNIEYEKLWNRYCIGSKNTLDFKEMLTHLGLNAEIHSQPERETVAKALIWDTSPQERAQQTPPCSPKIRSTKDCSLDELETALRRVISGSRARIVNAFHSYDAAQTGFISLDDFKTIQNHLIFPLSTKAFEELMTRYGCTASNRIAWKLFVSAYQDREPPENGQTIPIKPNHRVNPARSAIKRFSNDHIIHKLQKHFQESYHSLKDAFLMLDQERKGKISRKELRRIVDSMICRITDEQFKELMIILDSEHTGFISYHQFLDLFEEKESVTGHKWLNNKRETKKEASVPVTWDTMQNILCEKITRNWQGFVKAIKSYDSKGIGIVGKQDFKNILKSHCPSLSEEHFQIICEQYSDSSSDFITYMEFLQNLGVIMSHAGDLEGVSTNIFDGSQCREELRQTELSDRMREIDQHASNLTRTMSTDQVIEKLKACVTRHSLTTKDSFLTCKAQAGGKVSKKDFRKVLEDHELHLDDDQFHALTEKLGFTKEGLDYLDFVSLFEAPGSREGNVLQIRTNHRVNQARFNFMSAEECLSKLLDKLREGYEDTYTAFYKIDSNRDGIVTMHDFRNLLDGFMFIMTQKEYERLLNLLGLNLNSTLNYVEFLKLIQNQEKDDSPPWLNSVYKPKQSNECADLACEQAHYYLVKKAQVRWHDLAKTFCEFDSEGNGIVQKKDLRNVLFRFSIPITAKEFEKLWDRYDPEGKGYLTHQEFLHKLGLDSVSMDSGPSARIADENHECLEKHWSTQHKLHEEMDSFHKHQTKALNIKTIEQQVKDKFREYYQDFGAAFAKMDRNKDGLITLEDFRTMLQDMNFNLEDDQFLDLLCRLKMKVCGSKLSYFEFLKVVDDGRASKYDRQQESSARSDNFYTLSPQRALTKLKESVAASYDQLYTACSLFDKDDTGTITVFELRRILDSFCFKLTEKQFKYLVSKLMLGDDHTIDWQAFLHHFPASSDESNSTWAERVQKATRTKSFPKLSMKDILTHVQEVVTARFQTIVQAFVDLDYANRNVISKDDFRELFSRHFMLVTDEQFENLWNVLPLNSNGNLNYHEFLKKFSSERPAHPSEKPLSRDLDGSPKPDSSFKRNQTFSGSFSGIRRPKTAPPVLNKSHFRVYKHSQDSAEWITEFTNTNEQPQGPKLEGGEGVNEETDRVREGPHPTLRGVGPHKPLRARGFLPSPTTVVGDGVLKQFHLEVTEKELDQLTTKYDLRKNGKFSYSDFLRNIMLEPKTQEKATLRRMKLQNPRVPMSSGMHNPLFLDALLRIEPKILSCWRPMRRSFLSCDDTRSGYISIQDFKQVLQKYGINLSEDEFFHIVGYFDKELTSKISYNDFLREFLR
ncbi:EF-hand calcium-binding domain-containing 6 [Pelobates cultripes]|uniref:EF-hand calcium-binding domain-containing 6 n=1 Tax=Pelobates cultripes TaxID=61616 RepID=A0AAD1RYA4_PELCU|nr:EF-hand calcium-binding domain-containing 6 [Pelobates cultripes]CAH2278351.1 EF-hand calcium-binding domain-containing 6 [Pelobates cultripes]